MPRKYVFGPVQSRRLGSSLGVDLVTPKTCPLDCIYCEARATTLLTSERREYVPIAEVIAELDDVLRRIPPPDFITFSGAGEPTLNSGIGKVVEFLKTSFPQYRICLLTNGVLLNDPVLRREIAPVDLVIPSLDASNAEEYRKINRPVSGSTLEDLVRGIATFAREFTHRLVLELFIVPGVNDGPESIARFAELIGRIRPAAVQLNTIDRPGVIPDIRKASPETLAAFTSALSPICPVESVRPLEERRQHAISTSLEEDLLDILRHRKLTLKELSGVSGIPVAELAPLIKRLEARDWLRIAPDGIISLCYQCNI